MDVTLDTTLYIKPSVKLLTFIKHNCTAFTEINRKVEGKNCALNIEDLISIKYYLECNPSLKESFHQLIFSCHLILPKPVYPARDPILQARCDRLMVEQKNFEYDEMTKELNKGALFMKQDGKCLNNDSISSQIREINNFLVLVIQFVISSAAAFCCGFFAPYLLYGMTNMGFRIILGICFAFIVGSADMYFVLKQCFNEDMKLDIDTKKRL